MFLLMLLGRILCLQSREDSGFFVGFFFWVFFWASRHCSWLKEFFLSSVSGPQMWKDPSKICLLTIKALCSKERSSCGCLAHSFSPPRARWQVWTESCCLSPVLQQNVLYRVLLGSPEPAEPCVKSRIWLAVLLLLSMFAEQIKPLLFPFEFLRRVASGEISTTEGSASLCAFPLGKGETLPRNHGCSHILQSTLPPFNTQLFPFSVQSSDLSAFNEGFVGLWQTCLHLSVPLQGCQLSF